MEPRSLCFVGVPPDDEAMTMPVTTPATTTAAAVQNHQRPKTELEPSSGGADCSVTALSPADGGGASSFGVEGDAGAIGATGAGAAGARLRSRSSISLM